MKKRFREFILTALIGGIAACLLMSPVKAASSTMKIAAIRYINDWSAAIMFVGSSKQ